MGYNVARYSPVNGAIEIFLRTWNSDSAEWMPRQVKKLTDEHGRWRISNFGVAQPQPKPEFAPGQLALLRGESTIQELSTESEDGKQRSSRFDAFLAAPMAALNDQEYAVQRKETLRVAKSLRRHCGLKTIYNATTGITTQDEFEFKDVHEDVLEYIQKYGRELLDELRGVTIPEELRAR
jgi:hypothetical protein